MGEWTDAVLHRVPTSAEQARKRFHQWFLTGVLNLVLGGVLSAGALGFPSWGSLPLVFGVICLLMAFDARQWYHRLSD